MKVLVIGLGSMGKRRIRCLQYLGIRDIIGIDYRSDRREEAKSLYNIEVSECDKEIWKKIKLDFVVISLPPTAHVAAMKKCVNNGVPFFVEASVVDHGLTDVIEEVNRVGLLAAPSSTMSFHPAVYEINKIIINHQLGKISNIILHSGQYLPDWHTYESVADYYVSERLTGGAREIVPFELSWLTKIFGFPYRVAALFRKTIDINGAEEIDDTYNCLLDYGNFLATMSVDVVSRHATRRLTINGDKAQLVWSWDDEHINIYDGINANWKKILYKTGLSERGYNRNIGEKMYIDETLSFIDAVVGRGKFPNTLELDHKVLKLLYALEKSDRTATYQVV